MPNRILFLVSVILASLAPLVLLTMAHAADECLTSPPKATGGHWKYHLERGTGRKCWYLASATSKDDATKADATKPDTADADADGRNVDTTASVPPKPAAKIAPSLEAAASTAPERPRTVKPTPTPSPPATLGPANNARAEFIDAPRAAQPDAPQAAALDGNAQQGSAQQGSLATRWPNPGAAPAADGVVAAVDSTPAAQPAATEPQAAAGQPLQAAPATETAPTAQLPDPAEGPDYLLYALIIFTCAFATVVAFAGLRFMLEWWRDWREETRWHQSEQTYAGYRERSMTAIDEVPMGLEPANDAPMPWSSAQRPLAPEPSPPRIEDEIDRIEQLLALTRQTTPETQPSMWDAHAPRDAAE